MAKEKADDDAVHYRPGEALGRTLSELAGKWRLSRHEAGKRLALMAAHELEIYCYNLLADMAQLTGGVHAFETSCRHIQAAVESANQLRKSRNQKSLGEDRAAFIRDTATRYMQTKRQQQVTAEEEQQQQIQIVLRHPDP